MDKFQSILSYFFVAAPGSNFKYYIPVGLLAAVLIIGGLVFSKIYNQKKKTNPAFKNTFKKVSKHSVLMGLLFVFLMVVRYERIPYFSMRIWIYVSLLFLAFLVYKHVKAFKVDYPRELENTKLIQKTTEQRKSEQSKYLAKKKRR